MQRGLSRAVFGFLDRIILLLSFGEIAESGMGVVEGPISEKYAALMRALLAGPDYARLMGGPKDLAAPGLPAEWTRALTRRALGRARGGVEAACFVYAHTQLDVLAGELLGLVESGNPRPPLAARSLLTSAKACRLSRACGAGGSKALCARLARLDRLRDEVAAGRALGPFPEELQALLASGLELAALAARKLGARLDPSELLAP